jgi:hypothetical protein
VQGSDDGAGTITEAPIPHVEENWAHGLDHAGYMVPALDFDVLDGVVTKSGKTISLIVGMVVVKQVRSAWYLCASSGPRPAGTDPSGYASDCWATLTPERLRSPCQGCPR